jgi:trimeric autotransporter adhesin
MRHSFATVALLSSLSPLAIAQTCTPTWDRAPGTPGATNGYVGALWKYNGKIIASGSFTDMAGVPSTTYIAQYDEQTSTWSSVGNGLGAGISNAFGTSFATFGGDLYVGGFFSNASGVPDTKSLARWDGTQYYSLGTGWGPDTTNAVWSLLASNAIGGQNRLYIAGDFATIAGQPAGGVAMWDGTTLTPIATSMTISGINPYVPAMEIFDDGQGGGPQLYIGGRFTTVNGLTAPMVARWNGTTWSAVGTNLTPRNATADIDCFLVWNDGSGPALFAGGSNLRVNADGINRSAVKWNGSTWSVVGQYVGGRTWTLAAFDDGNGEKLYGGGTLPASGFIYRMDAPNTWTSLESGASASVFRFFVDNDALWVGGSFTSIAGGGGNRIVARRACTVSACDSLDFNNDTSSFDPQDIEAFLSVFSEGPCIPATATCNDIDFNNDGALFDPCDIDSYLLVFSEGPCTLCGV